MIQSLATVVIALEDIEAGAADYALLLGRNASAVRDIDGARIVSIQTSNISVALVAPMSAGWLGDAVRARLALAGPGQWKNVFAVGDLAKAASLCERRGFTVAQDHTIGAALADAPSGGLALSLPVTHLTEIELITATSTHAASSPVVKSVDEASTITGLDHVVIRSPNPERAIALYGGRLGLDMRLDRTNTSWGARLMFFRCGDLVVEIAHNLKDGVSDAPDSFGGLSWRATNIAATRGRLLQAGVNVSELRKGRSPGSQIFTVRSHTGGVPTVVLDKFIDAPSRP